ncbi:ribonuclease P protein component [Nakamurella silvestris]|nr:ribonuclease P protein component [Nakamurella silvestris]
MLPAKARLNKAEDFSLVVRTGQRAGTRHVAVHLLSTSSEEPPRAGFVVSAKVGNSVIRHRVTRRLRHQILPMLAGLAPGTHVVVRALPAAAGATSTQLSADLTAGIGQASLKMARKSAAQVSR